MQLDLKSNLSELIFFGTGTSGCVPSVHCLTAPKPECKTCLDAFQNAQSKNKRMNTSIMLRTEDTNVLIDCGKTFYSQAIQWCGTYRIRQLDAVFLSHNHADAMLGLDDLRQWTLNKSIQEKIDVYLTQDTFASVNNVFPYLVDTSKASGGGDVAGLQFHILEQEDDEFLPVRIGNLSIQPFEVEHGKIGADIYYSLGFKVDTVVYISDTNRIPDKSRKYLDGCEVFIVDALHEKPHFSHFSIDQALEEVKRVEPTVAFFTGFSHRVNHDETQKQLVEEKKAQNVFLAWDGLRVEFNK